MITLTRRTAYRFLVQAVALLIIYGALLLTETPMDTLAGLFLKLAITGGLIGAGIYTAASEQPDFSLPREAWLVRINRVWLGMILLTLAAAALQIAVPGEFLAAIPALCTVIIVWRVRQHSRMIRVWIGGMVYYLICIVMSALMPAGSAWDQVFALLSLYAAIVAALGPGYWLIRRFSEVPQVWVEGSLYTTAVMLTLAGVLISLAPLNLPDWFRVPGAVLVSIFCLIYAAHSYKPLSTRNATHTLAAHWYSLAVILVLFGPALLGALNLVYARWTLNTPITDTLSTMTVFVTAAILLGVTNQVGAELRGHNWRVTGLMPFWLVTFGLIGSALMLGTAGVVQVYLERILSVDVSQTRQLLTPLFDLRRIFVVSVLLGFVIYALGLWARRPSFVER